MRPNRHLERDLIQPALEILVECENDIAGITTTELARKLRERITSTPDDLAPLTGRNDDRLSQVIRNLVSHRTLERRGLATYKNDPLTGQGAYRLTPLGRRTLAEPATEPQTYS